MHRQMLKSKIHRATVTGCDPDYVGSLTLDPELLRSADLIANEQVHVWDIDNGARFVTYAIEDEPGSGTVQVNGAAARLVNEGDKVIVASFGAYDQGDLETYAPVVLHVDDRNAIVRVDSHPEVLFDSPLASEADAKSAGVLGSASAAGGLAWDEVPGSLIPNEVVR
jgi:aspartate 1-decarboxylase